MKVKKCPECGFEIMGRADKVFCSDACRTKNNNRKQKNQNRYIRKINKSLKKNRQILLFMLLQGKFETTRNELLESGFDFKHFTRLEMTDEQQTLYCYDVGYLFLDKERIKLLRNTEA